MFEWWKTSNTNNEGEKLRAARQSLADYDGFDTHHICPSVTTATASPTRAICWTRKYKNFKKSRRKYQQEPKDPEEDLMFVLKKSTLGKTDSFRNQIKNSLTECYSTAPKTRDIESWSWRNWFAWADHPRILDGDTHHNWIIQKPWVWRQSKQSCSRRNGMKSKGDCRRF